MNLEYSGDEFVLDETNTTSVLSPGDKIRIYDLIQQYGHFTFPNEDYPGKDNNYMPKHEEGNSFYFGQVDSSGNKQGKGRLISPDLYCEGYFDNDELNGNGRYYLPSGEFYAGVIKNGDTSGFRRYISHNGISYTGEWSNSVREGKGVEEWPDGTRYVGDFRDNLRHGKG